MIITAEINRDSEGFPSIVVLKKGGRKVTVTFDKDNQLKISGRLTSEFRDILQLIYPYSEKLKVETYESSELVYGDVSQAGAGNAIIYTVPAKKKLVILNCYLTTWRRGAGATPEGQLYIWNPYTNESIDLLYHIWTFTTVDVLSNVTKLEWAVPSSWSIRVYCVASSNVDAGFIGVLKDV